MLVEILHNYNIIILGNCIILVLETIHFVLNTKKKNIKYIVLKDIYIAFQHKYLHN